MKFYSVQTDSMSPVLQPGDLTITLRPDRLQPGDIVTYRALNNPRQIISHRLIQIYPSRGYAITKGDNLAKPDPTVPISSVTGKTVKVIPKIGYGADILRSPAGLIGFVYLPALALATFEISRLAAALNYQAYGLGSQKH